MAGEILSANGNRLLLIEAILILLLNVSLYVLLDATMYAVFNDLLAISAISILVFTAVYGILASVLALFITLPSIVGLLYFAGKIAYGASPMLAELFEPFSSSKSYARAMHLAWGAFWRIGLLVAAASLTRVLFDANFTLSVLGGLVIVIEVVIWLLLTARRFPDVAILLFSTLSAKDARRYSNLLSKHVGFCGVRFFFGFFWWILLGLLTFGVSMLWDTLPRMLIAYFCYLKKLNEMIIHSEE